MRHISAVEAARATGRDSDILLDSASRCALDTLGTQHGLGANGSTGKLDSVPGLSWAGAREWWCCTGTAVGDFNTVIPQILARGGDTPILRNGEAAAQQ